MKYISLVRSKKIAKVVLLAAVFCGIYLFVMSDGQPAGIYAGSPLLTTLNGSSKIEIVGHTVFERQDDRQDGGEADKFAMITPSNERGIFIIRNHDDIEISRVIFYRFHAYFFRPEQGGSGIGLRCLIGSD